MKQVDQLGRVLLALSSSHAVDVVCTAQFGGDNIGDVLFTDGVVTNDESLEVRSRLQITVPVQERYASTEFDPRDLNIDGWRLFIEYGVVVGPDEVIYVPLGTFVVYDIDDAEDDRGRLLQITGYDTTVMLRDDDIELPTAIASGTTYDIAMNSLVTAAGLYSRFPGTNFTSPGLVLKEGDKRLTKLNEMAQSVGWGGVKSDSFGTIVDATAGITEGSTAVWDFVEGDGCTMTNLSRARSRTKVYNIGIAIGEPPGSTAPVIGAAYDDDNDSHTYVTAATQGQFGRKPKFLRTQFITTQAQADLAAANLRDSSKGIGSALRITGWANPLLEPGDQVAIRRERFNIDRIIPLQSVEISLTPGAVARYVTREAIFR